MVTSLVLTVCVPLFLFSLGLILFSDRSMDYHQENMRKGKEFVWQNRFQPEIGNLVQELDSQIDLGQRLVQFREKVNDDDQGNPDGVDTLDDIGQAICMETPYTNDIRKVTEAIGNHAELVNQLESDCQDIPIHLRKIGLLLLAASVIPPVVSVLYMRDYTSAEFAALYVLTLLVPIGIHTWGHMDTYLSKKDRLREYAENYEENREL